MFKRIIQKKTLWFFLVSGEGGYKLPPSIKVKNSAKMLVRYDNTPIQSSLFEYVPEDEFNDLEKAVALYIDEQERMLWWYRNLSRQDYSIQGWKKDKIYPDFIFSEKDLPTGRQGKKAPKDYSKVYVIETKGLHLKNEDTAYKKSVFDFCNKLGQQKDWRELGLEFSGKKVDFQVIYEDEWKNEINRIFVV